LALSKEGKQRDVLSVNWNFGSLLAKIPRHIAIINDPLLRWEMMYCVIKIKKKLKIKI
jgi:hypothetical protein